ncbi:VanZ family protein [Halosimplex aquaticum]|uniref:VanZ family protein n=1 Tax=Halosimplex aquaticum TaxID=3026162 RepID=A0ABD5Y542_9EURY|nr:VanZ family protein [Halosimplex aquaticum]
MELSDASALPAPTRFSIACGFALAVVFASLAHPPAFVDQTGMFGDVGIDKWIHAGSYALVTFLLAYAVLAESVLSLVGIAAVAIALGIGVEFVQSTIAWRSKEAADVIANVTGTIVAVGAWKLVQWWLPAGPNRSGD